MDKNIKYKVYINPNFKGNAVNSTNTNYSNNTYINQHYIEFQNQKLENHPIPGGNRKIYVNPNFLPVRSSTLEDYYEPREQISCKRNENLNKAPEYEYSLVNNVVMNQNHQVSERTQITYQGNISNIGHGRNDQNVVPVTRSRYCIIRKKQQVPDAVTKINSLTLNSTTSNDIQTKSCSSKPADKVIKIKISKYKTVPAVSYLNKPQVNNKIKLNTATPQIKMAQYANLAINKPSSFKYVKQNKTLTINKNITKPVMKNNVIVNKSKWQSNTSKSKLLKANFKINNIPCRLFAKYGKCLRQTYGSCQYLHDKKHVSLCRKFLKGICHDTNCSLSHESTAKKIPTCYFYLKGMCNKENCPYLHIKMSDKVKICQDFLKGYCESGDKCNFRHIRNTQKQSEANNIKTNRKLLNKSIVVKAVKVKKIDKEKVSANDKEEIDSTKECDVEHRYYKEMCLNEDTCQTINIKPLRCKLGTLPSYIQL